MKWAPTRQSKSIQRDMITKKVVPSSLAVLSDDGMDFEDDNKGIHLAPE